MPVAIARFAEQHPAVELSMSLMEPEDAVAALRAGDIDLAITVGAGKPGDREGEGVTHHHLLEDPMYLVLPENHPLARKRGVRLADLADEPWIGGAPNCECNKMITQACMRFGFDPRIAFETDDYSAVQGFVAAGVGVSLIAELGLRTVRDDIVVRPLGRDTPVRQIYATALKGYRSPATAAMIEVLREVGRGPRRASPGARARVVAFGPMSDDSGRTVGSVARALALLDALAEGPAGVNALARRIGVNPSSASRLLATLERGGLVEREPGGPYRLGLHLVALADRVLARLDVRELARPQLRALVEETGETATLSVPGGDEAVTVDFVAGESSVVSMARLGRPSIGHATAAGKVMLAFGGREPQALHAYTERTITDPARLARRARARPRAGLGRGGGRARARPQRARRAGRRPRRGARGDPRAAGAGRAADRRAPPRRPARAAGGSVVRLTGAGRKTPRDRSVRRPRARRLLAPLRGAHHDPARVLRGGAGGRARRRLGAGPRAGRRGATRPATSSSRSRRRPGARPRRP